MPLDDLKDFCLKEATDYQSRSQGHRIAGDLEGAALLYGQYQAFTKIAEMINHVWNRTTQ